MQAVEIAIQNSADNYDYHSIIINGVVTDYKFSNSGIVVSFKKKGMPRILKTSGDKRGYLRIYAYIKGDRYIVPIHRIVAKQFVENKFPEKYDEVNHKDGDKTNNNYWNLEWCTGSMNVQHAFETGLRKAKKGKENHRSRQVASYNNGVLVKKYDSLTLASKEDGCTPCGICEAIKKNNKHRGFNWKYID